MNFGLKQFQTSKSFQNTLFKAHSPFPYTCQYPAESMWSLRKALGEGAF